MSDCFKQVITELHPRRNRSLQQLRKETGFVEIILFQGPSGHPISRHLALGLYHHDWVSQDAKSHLPSLRGRLLVQPILLFCFLKIYLFIYVCEYTIAVFRHTSLCSLWIGIRKGKQKEILRNLQLSTIWVGGELINTGGINNRR